MRIRDALTGQPIQMLELRLTVAEAIELRDDLEVLIDDRGDRHEHVSSADYQTELTISVDHETDGESAPLS